MDTEYSMDVCIFNFSRPNVTNLGLSKSEAKANQNRCRETLITELIQAQDNLKVLVENFTRESTR